jgi:hypothetical protein
MEEPDVHFESQTTVDRSKPSIVARFISVLKTFFGLKEASPGVSKPRTDLFYSEDSYDPLYDAIEPNDASPDISKTRTDSYYSEDSYDPLYETIKPNEASPDVSKPSTSSLAEKISLEDGSLYSTIQKKGTSPDAANIQKPKPGLSSDAEEFAALFDQVFNEARASRSSTPSTTSATEQSEERSIGDELPSDTMINNSPVPPRSSDGASEQITQDVNVDSGHQATVGGMKKSESKLSFLDLIKAAFNFSRFGL